MGHEFSEIIDYHKEKRHEYDSGGDSGNHTEEYARSDVLAALRTRAAGKYKRKHTEDKCQGGHHDRSEPEFCRSDCRIHDIPARLDLFLGELHNQDGVFRHQTHQHHKSNLEIYVTLHPQEGDAEISSENRNRQRQYHRNRYRPALILGGKEQEHKKQCQSKYQSGLSALLFLLIGHSAPFHPDIGRKVFPGDLLKNLQRLSRADSVCRLSTDCRRVVHIETLYGSRTSCVVGVA